MLILLIGPKGSGKSHIGRLLESRFGVHFFPMEKQLMAYYAECDRTGAERTTAGGIAAVDAQLHAALRTFEHVSAETAGVRPERVAHLLSMADADTRRIIRVTAPLAICLRRIATREQAEHIPVPRAEIERMYALSMQLQLPFDLEVENVGLDDDALVERLVPLFTSTGDHS